MREAHIFNLKLSYCGFRSKKKTKQNITPTCNENYTFGLLFESAERFMFGHIFDSLWKIFESL